MARGISKSRTIEGIGTSRTEVAGAEQQVERLGPAEQQLKERYETIIESSMDEDTKQALTEQVSEQGKAVEQMAKNVADSLEKSTFARNTELAQDAETARSSAETVYNQIESGRNTVEKSGVASMDRSARLAEASARYWSETQQTIRETQEAAEKRAAELRDIVF